MNSVLAPKGGTATIENNRLVIEGKNGEMVEFTDSGPLSRTIGLKYDAETQGFSQYFGLNDFFTSNPATDALLSAARGTSDTSLSATGRLTIRTGAGKYLEIDYNATDTLETLRDKINAESRAAGRGDIASIIADGNRVRLSITDDGNMRFSDSGGLTSTIGLDSERLSLSRDLDVVKQLQNDPARISRGRTNASQYKSTEGVSGADTPVPGLGTGKLTIYGKGFNASFSYNADTSLRKIADAINNDASLTNRNIRARVENAADSKGHVLRITDADGNSFLIDDTNESGGLLKTIGLDTLPHGVNSGDNLAATDLAGQFTGTGIEFDAAGGLSSKTTSLIDYSAGILSNNATQADAASNDYDFQNKLTKNLDTKVKNLSAVNIEEEMADLVILQKSYAASARVIATVDKLFSDLLEAV